jgi:hypothetical protein
MARALDRFMQRLAVDARGLAAHGTEQGPRGPGPLVAYRASSTPTARSKATNDPGRAARARAHGWAWPHASLCARAGFVPAPRGSGDDAITLADEACGPRSASRGPRYVWCGGSPTSPRRLPTPVGPRAFPQSSTKRKPRWPSAKPSAQPPLSRGRAPPFPLPPSSPRTSRTSSLCSRPTQSAAARGPRPAAWVALGAARRRHQPAP